jgi:sugar lactone lactonase YvrE
MADECFSTNCVGSLWKIHVKKLFQVSVRSLSVWITVFLALTAIAHSQGPFTQGSPIQVVGLNPTGSIVFPTTIVGNSSASQNIQVMLTNDETVSAFTVPQSVGGKQEFVVGTVTGCTTDGQTINSYGTICRVPVMFSPAYPGIRRLALQFSVNQEGGFGNQGQAVGLSGTGTAPLAALTPGAASVLTTSITGVPIGLDGPGNIYFTGTSSNYATQVMVRNALTGTISGFAGGARYGGTVEGVPATSTQLGAPSGIAADAAGDVFIADSYNNKVFVVLAGSGLIYTLVNHSYFAGNIGSPGVAGHSGDGGPAYYALVSAPTGLAVDAAGDLYISDTGNNCIRRMDAATLNISTVAGVAASGPGYSGDGGSAALATLSSPQGIAVDSAGNLYIADSGNNRIRRVDATSGVITTIAGNGTAGYSGDGSAAISATLYGPMGLAVDSAGNIYFADQNSNNGSPTQARVRKVDIATGNIYSVVGGGATPVTSQGQTSGATGLQFGAMYGVAVDADANLYANGNSIIPPAAGQTASTTGYGLISVQTTTGALAFPTQTLVGTPDTTDNPLPVYVSNVGNSVLTESSPASGTNPTLSANWSVDASSPCQPLQVGATAGSIASGSSCRINLDFTPPVAGTTSGMLVFTDNSLGGTTTQTEALSGTGGNAADTNTSLAFSFVANAPSGYPQTALTYDSIDTLTATVQHTAAGATSAINGTVTFYANGNALSGGSNINLTNGTASFTFQHLVVPGTIAFTASFSPSGNLNASTSATVSESVGKAYVVFSGTVVDNHIYDGNPHGVVFNTIPSDLGGSTGYYPIGSSVLYETATPPTAAGFYYAQYLLTSNADYAGNAQTVLRIYGLPATITLSNFSAAYDGNPHGATATTSPAGLKVTLYYYQTVNNYQDTAPTAAGRYGVVATIQDTAYEGRAYGTLDIYPAGTATTAWIVNSDSTVAHLSSAGAVTATAGVATGTSTLGSIAIDSSGNAWAVTNSNTFLEEVSPSGTLLGSYIGGGLSTPVGVAVDGLGRIWVANANNSVSTFSTTGAAISGSSGYLAATSQTATSLSTPSGIAIDPAGSVWIPNAANSTVTRVFGAAAPVITPSVLGVASSSQGVRP